MRIVGAILVIGASTLLGVLVANNYRERPRLLQDLALAVEMLRSQISYSMSPLPAAFRAVAGMSRGTVAALFDEAARLMESGDGLTGSEAWNAAVDSVLSAMPLDADELLLVRDVGRPLGISDRSDQEKHLSLSAENVRRQLARVQETAARSARLWCYLGISGGAILVLLLL